MTPIRLPSMASVSTISAFIGLPAWNAPPAAYWAALVLIGLMAVTNSRPFRLWINGVVLKRQGASSREIRQKVWRIVYYPGSPDPTLPKSHQQPLEAPALRAIPGGRVDTD